MPVRLSIRPRLAVVASAAVLTLSAAAGQAQTQGQRPITRPAAPATQTPAQAPVQTPSQPAAAKEPDLPRTLFIQSMDSEFRKRDANGDGKITRAELEQFERNVAIAMAQANNRALFNRLDVDRNGVLSPGEFAALVQDPGVPDVAALMVRFDQNRDQTVTLVEYRTATLANFDKIDTDKDGIVTDAEMKASAVRSSGPNGR